MLFLCKYSAIFYLCIDGWIETDVGVYKILNGDGHGICSTETGCTWEESKEVCEKEGGYLAKITSQAENDKIEELQRRMQPNGNKFLYHIGLNDIEEEGIYRWESDGSLMTFDNFYRGKNVLIYRI